MTTRCLDCSCIIPYGERCTLHRRAKKRTQNARRFQQSGGGWGITAMRARIAQRDYVCVQCGDPGRWELDHIIPLAKGGTFTEDNLQRLCVRDHRAKTARQQQEG